jgi:hypothetical protein
MNEDPPRPPLRRSTRISPPTKKVIEQSETVAAINKEKEKGRLQNVHVK